MAGDRKSQIGGQPLKLVRDCLQQRHNGYIKLENIVDHLQQNWWHGIVEDLLVPRVPDFSVPAQTLFNYLLAKGYIEPDEHFKAGWHRTTIKGQALKMAKLVPRINRAKAETLLKGVLERCCNQCRS